MASTNGTGAIGDIFLKTTPPNDRASEIAVIGGIFLDPAMLDAAREHVSAEDFYATDTKLAFLAMERVAARGAPIDVTTIVTELRDMGELERAGGALRVSNYRSSVPSAGNTPYYARLVRELSDAWREFRAYATAARVVIEGGGTVSDRRQRAQKLVHETVPAPSRGHEVREAVLVRMDTVERRSVAYVWAPYVPVGMLTILEGEPSCGKTWLVLSLAAQLSRGWETRTADGERHRDEPRATIYMTAENPLAEVVGPRLDMLGADSSRIHMLESWSTQRGRTGRVTLKDVDVLEDACRRVRPALIVIDPVQSYLGSDVDMNQANEVRPVLEHLTFMARRQNAAVMIVRHFGKSTQGRAANRGLGSIDFFAAATSVIQAGRIEGPDDGGEAQRAYSICHPKNNVGDTGPALGYVIEGGCGLRWTGESGATAADLQAPEAEGGPAVREAMEVLGSLLANKEGVLAQAAISEGRSQGISERTMKRASQRLKVVRTRDGESGPWRWRLPRAVAR